MATLIDGKKIAGELRLELQAKVAAMEERGVVPGIAIVLVGDDPASQTYARSKRSACEKLKIRVEEHFLPAAASQEEVLEVIEGLNRSREIDGILVEMPMPPHIDAHAVVSAIAPEKDVDCCTPVNVGRLFLGDYDFAPCTPSGCMELLDRSGVELQGKNCVVLGRGNFVGKPMAMMLMERHATVTICHSRTLDLEKITRRADVLVSAIGKPRFITGEMVKEGAVVIDIGTNRGPDGKLCGDVDFDAVAPKASMITPVPGGVGPMTVTVVLRNTVSAAERRLSAAQP